jgi:hypothetical protein
MIRVAAIGLYAVFLALGTALLARPAVLWARAVRLRWPTPWEFPPGWAAALLACALAVLALVVALRVAARRTLRRRHHVALLLLVGLALAARAALPLAR